MATMVIRREGEKLLAQKSSVACLNLAATAPLGENRFGRVARFDLANSPSPGVPDGTYVTEDS
jgi:hypothetical protein